MRNNFLRDGAVIVVEANINGIYSFLTFEQFFSFGLKKVEKLMH